MVKYKKIHESKEVAKSHIDKIQSRGGKVEKFSIDGKIVVEYYFPKTKSFIGFRNIKSSTKGKYGTFYNVKKPKNIETKEVRLTFKTPLIVKDKNVYNFEGLSLEYLFWKWFPHLEKSYIITASKQGIETGELIDKLVTNEAIKRGYDGIIMADLEIIDLTSHDNYKV